jgi:hypothetical protein
MECDYTHLYHNLLVSHKTSDHQGRDYKGGLLYMPYNPFCLFDFWVNSLDIMCSSVTIEVVGKHLPYMWVRAGLSVACTQCLHLSLFEWVPTSSSLHGFASKKSLVWDCNTGSGM